MRRFPLTTFLVVGTVGNIGVTNGWYESTVDYVFNLALFSAALRVPRQRRFAILAIWVGVDTWYSIGTWDETATFGGVVAYVTEEAMAFFAGRWIATHNALLREIETARDSQLTSDIANERATIAREIHDIVGHYLATIVLHAGGGRLRLGSSAEHAAAREAFTAIEEAGRQAMTETQSALGVLRDHRPPAFDLRAVQRLIEDTRRAGVEVSLTITGANNQASVPDDCIDEAGYRIVQESLTNATKHGAGNVAIDLAVTGNTVRIAVTNPLRPKRQGLMDIGSSGTGIDGMRKRVAERGGNIDVRVANNIFTLVAEIPSGAS